MVWLRPNHNQAIGSYDPLWMSPEKDPGRVEQRTCSTARLRQEEEDEAEPAKLMIPQGLFYSVSETERMTNATHPGGRFPACQANLDSRRTSVSLRRTRDGESCFWAWRRRRMNDESHPHPLRACRDTDLPRLMTNGWRRCTNIFRTQFPEAILYIRYAPAMCMSWNLWPEISDRLTQEPYQKKSDGWQPVSRFEALRSNSRTWGVMSIFLRDYAMKELTKHDVV